MSFFLNAIRQVLGSAPASRSIAKDRLSVMLVHQRNLDALESVDMEALKKEVADVIAKHIKLAKNKPTHFLVNKEGEFDLLEMHFPIDMEAKVGRRM